MMTIMISAKALSTVSLTRPSPPSTIWMMHCKLLKRSNEMVDSLTSHRMEKKLSELSSLGHFLKGSSATLGLTKIKDSCEKIQHYGAGKDETGAVDEPDEEVSLKNIKSTLAEVKVEYKDVEKFLRRFYGEKVKAEEEPKKKGEEEKEKEA